MTYKVHLAHKRNSRKKDGSLLWPVGRTQCNNRKSQEITDDLSKVTCLKCNPKT